MFGPRLRTNVHPTSSRRRPGSRHGCLSSVLFLIRRLTLRPLVEDTSDKSQTLEGVTLEQKTPYLICIWPLKEVSSIFPFIFSNLSDAQKNNERSGKHVQHLEVFLFFNLVHCSIHVIVTLQPFLNTPFPSNKPPPPPFCPSFLAMDPINEEESKYLLTIQMRNQWQVVSKEKKKI